MDYGHTSHNGAGTNSADTDNFGAENNQDRASKDILQANPLADRDLRNMGGSAIDSAEASSRQEESAPSPELGKIINLAMPPGAKQDNPSKTAKKADIIEFSLNYNVIKTKEHLEEAAIKEIDNSITRLKQTGNVADFYDAARNAMEANVDNSYERKLAA